MKRNAQSRNGSGVFSTRAIIREQKEGAKNELAVGKTLASIPGSEPCHASVAEFAACWSYAANCKASAAALLHLRAHVSEIEHGEHFATPESILQH